MMDPTTRGPPRTILLLPANPHDTPRLRLDEELRAIELGLGRSRHRGSFRVVVEWPVSYGDLGRCLLEHRPRIVHFSGYGSGRAALVFEDENGGEGPISSKVLHSLFTGCAEYVQCVVLNGCNSNPVAAAIAKHIDYVIEQSRCDLINTRLDSMMHSAQAWPTTWRMSSARRSSCRAWMSFDQLSCGS